MMLGKELESKKSVNVLNLIYVCLVYFEIVLTAFQRIQFTILLTPDVQLDSIQFTGGMLDNDRDVHTDMRINLLSILGKPWTIVQAIFRMPTEYCFAAIFIVQRFGLLLEISCPS